MVVVVNHRDLYRAPLRLGPGASLACQTPRYLQPPRHRPKIHDNVPCLINQAFCCLVSFPLFPTQRRTMPLCLIIIFGVGGGTAIQTAPAPKNGGAIVP